MNRRQRGESLSERLRSEVQVSAALWQIGARVDDKAATTDIKSGNIRATVTNTKTIGSGFPCPREVKPLLFFYKYLQPIRPLEAATTNNNNLAPIINNKKKKLRVNLPLTVVCERTNAQELVLWLRTDVNGNVIREEKTPLWRKKLHSELVGLTSDPATNSSSNHENDAVLAVRSAARWKTSTSNGGSAVVLTRKTLDPVLAVPCELPMCIQQFVQCRGTQASVYRIFWSKMERKCFAVNLTNSLKSTEVPEDDAIESISAPPPSTSGNGLSSSTMAAMNAAFEAAMATAAEISQFYCVTVSPDAKACARWPKLRGVTIAEGVQATSRIVEHVQLQLPALYFHSMTADFIKDTNGVWWLTRVVDFQAFSSIEPPRDEECFSSRESAVIIPDVLRLKTSQLPRMEEGESLYKGPILTRKEQNNALNARICFLCGCSCELPLSFQSELQLMLKDHNDDEFKAQNTVPMVSSTPDEYRMTLTMALDTIFWMRQRGVSLSVWENAVSTVKKAQIRDVCDFPVCMLCYRVYQQQSRLQLIARELHHVFLASNNELDSNEDTIEESGVGMATSAASGLSTSHLLSTELRHHFETPKNVLNTLDTYRTEAIPPTLLLRGNSPETRPTWNILTPIRGADIDPTSTQLRFVFFFHELQDGGPDLVPTDFFLEYQLGQNVTRVQLEGSKRHTPNRWQLAEARVHYLCATLAAFSEFCSHKRLLIKMKAKSQEKEKFFGYTLLSFRQVITAAKGFGNSLQSESRTDYLLELHTASSGLLTLKLTVGLLVDLVPLSHVRDMLRDRIFLEEQPPKGVYWPPPTYCLGGLAVPQDWVGALMPSEYTKLLPRRRREVPGTMKSVALTHSRTQTSFQSEVKTSPSVVTIPSPDFLDQPEKSVQISSFTSKKYAQSARELPLDISNLVVNDTQLMSVAMMGTTLTRVCMAAKRIVFRVTEDNATKNFPTVLLAAILRYAAFNSSLNWKIPANFQFTRRYSVDRLLTEVKPGNLPMLAFLGELLFVLLMDRSVPDQVDVSTLETLVEPFWQQNSGWKAIPRTQTSCLPDHRVVWNRALRRWKAANIDNEPLMQNLKDENVVKVVIPTYSLVLMNEIGVFRAKTLDLVLCELFEHMETLDNGYIEIAELRSLAKCFLEEEYLSDEEQLDAEIGMRERLMQEEIESLGRFVEQQRRLAVRTLLHSLMASEIMEDALAQFDRLGSGEMSLEDFRELTAEALVSQRRVFHEFLDEPRKSQLGFCLRHGFAELYSSDGVCILCATEYQVEKSPEKPENSPEKSSAKPEIPISSDITTNSAVDTVQVGKFSTERTFSGRKLPEVDFSLESPRNVDFATTRRSSSPKRLERCLSSGKMIEDVPNDTIKDPIFQRRQAVAFKPEKLVDAELSTMLSRLHAAERTIVSGETQVVERKSSTTSQRDRQSLQHNSSCSDLEILAATCRRKSSIFMINIDSSAGLEKAVKNTKKRVKTRILKKTIRRLKSTHPLPPSASLSKLLRMELSDRKHLTTRASEDLIHKAVRIEEKRKQLDRLVLTEVQEVKRRLANLFDDE